MKAIFDADGVLYDTESFQAEKAIPYFEKHKYEKLVKKYAYRICEMFNCTEEREIEFWKKTIVEYALFFKMRPYAKEVINQMIAEGVEIIIATAKPYAKSTKRSDKIKFAILKILFEAGLILNGLNVKKIKIEYCSVENSAIEKAEICRRENATFIVEDSIENAIEVRDTTDTKVLLMYTKHSKDKNPENITRVSDFNDIYIEWKKQESNATLVPSIFTQYQDLSTDEKRCLTLEQRNQLYDQQQIYYSSLPFNHNEIEKGERNFNRISTILTPLLKKKYNIKVMNEELLQNLQGNYILVSNHVCDADMPVIMTVLGNLTWHPLIKTDLSKGKVGILFNAIRSITVDRTDSISRRNATRELGKNIVNGKTVLVFPEGTYGGENMIPFQPSPFYLSQVCQSPILMVSLTYMKPDIIVGLKHYGIVGREQSIDLVTSEVQEEIRTMVQDNKKKIKIIKA